MRRTTPSLRSRVGAMVVGAGLGASLWVSAGVLAVVDADRGTRVGALPSTGRLWAAMALGVMACGWALPRIRSWAPLSLLVLLWLPWLPWPVPPAGLVWEGPIEAAIWAASAAGVLWASGAGRALGRSHVLLTTPARAPWVVGAVAAIACATAWIIDRPRVPAGDEPHYLVITQSLIADGDLRIENNHRDGAYLAYYDGVLKPDFMRRGADREIYSIHAPGVSVLVLPAFLIAGYAGAVAMVIAVAAIGVALTWRVAYALTASVGGAWLAAAALAVSAPFLLHGFTIYPDPVALTLAMVGVATLVALEGGRRIRAAQWLWTGTALALLPWLHTRFALVAGTLGGALALRAWRQGGIRATGELLGVPLLSALAWFAYFWIIYGTPSPAAPYGVSPGGGLTFVPTGLAGLLVDQQFGLTAHAPILGVSILSLALLVARRRRLGIELALAAGVYLCAAASYPMWWGGYSAPARFAVAVLPLLALSLAVAWDVATAPLRAVLLGLLALSAAVSAALVGVDRGAFIYNGRDGYDLFLDWVNRSVDLTLAAPSVHRDGPAAAAVVALIWGLAATLVAAAVSRLARSPGGAGGRVAAWLAVPLTVAIAATIVWAGETRDVVTLSTSQMSLLERWRRAPDDLVVQLTPTRRLDPADVPRRLSLGSSSRGPRRPDAPLLQIPGVPAGTFDVFVEVVPGATPSGSAVVRLGRHELPLATWQFDQRPPGFTGLVLDLPRPAHSITVMGDAAALASIRSVSLRPRALPPPANTAAIALRAMRAGPVTIFALDDNAYLEPGAVWVRGERTAEFVVVADAPGAPVVRIAAGPVANDVILRAGAWSQRVSLAPNASTDVRLPADALAPAALTITSASGFRPSRDGTGDIRWLGAYLTWPAPTSTP